jgi:hypothetical protein
MSNGVSAAPFSVSATFALAMRGLMIEKRVRERPGVISGRVGSCDISGNLQKIVKHTAANNSGFVLDNRVYTAAKNAVRAFTLDFDGMEYTSLITGAYSSHSPSASSPGASRVGQPPSQGNRAQERIGKQFCPAPQDAF